MRTKKFNLICTAVAILGWGVYMILATYSDALAILFPVAAVALGVIGEVFIKPKKSRDNPDEASKIDARSVFHYILTFLMLLVIFYSFSVFSKPSYGYHHFGSGKYGYEISFWSLGEIIPDFACNLGQIILPILLLVFAVYCKPIAACAAGLLSWVNILIINTSKVFGSYYIVAAAGNKSERETIVYNYADTVVKAVCVLAAASLILALASMIVRRPKKAAVVCVLIASMIGSCIFAYMGYTSYVKGNTYDIEGLKSDIYISTKEGSERFQAENFFNSFGDMSTKCAYPGCERMIVTSGDSNCCAVHSNRCTSCSKYIDGDAMYCMDCIRDAIK